MKNYVEAETPKLIEMSSPQGIIVPDIGVIAYKVEILLNASQLKLVKSALEHGKRLIQIRLARTKRPRKRCTTEIEGNVKPVNVRTEEEKARYNNHKSEKHFIRLVNTNFTSAAYYVTLTYNNEH